MLCGDVMKPKSACSCMQTQKADGLLALGQMLTHRSTEGASNCVCIKLRLWRDPECVQTKPLSSVCVTCCTVLVPHALQAHGMQRQADTQTDRQIHRDRQTDKCKVWASMCWAGLLKFPLTSVLL